MAVGRCSRDVLDAEDVRIAMELFKSGYYDPAIRKRVPLKTIAGRVRLSVPALMERKKRLESLGVGAILAPRLSRNDLRRAANALDAIVKPRAR